MHLRRLPRLSAPAQTVHWLVLNRSGENADASFRHVDSLARAFGREPLQHVKHVSFAIDGLQFIWEEHSEFCTYTFVKEGAFAHPFAELSLNQLPAGWMAAMPGLTFRATRVALMSSQSEEPTRDHIDRLFSADDVICCDVFDRAARVWTDFRRAGDGFGRLLIHDNGLIGADAPRLVQQLLELGNYRKMALLGLPIAQHLGRELRTAETELAELSTRIAGCDNDETLLKDVSTLAARLARLAADNRYRLGATRAYANIVADRLENLAVTRLAGSASLKEFNERRLLPAVRTCESASQRLEGLSEQASWANGLIRTRIDTATNRQSRDLLASMDRRTQMQLRLQQTVEGLSVVAISYYVVGLMHYLAEAAGEARLGTSISLFTGAAVPFVVGITMFSMRRVHHKLKEVSDRPSLL